MPALQQLVPAQSFLVFSAKTVNFRPHTRRASVSLRREQATVLDKQKGANSAGLVLAWEQAGKARTMAVVRSQVGRQAGESLPAESAKQDHPGRRVQSQAAGRASHVEFEARPSMLSSEHPDNSYRGFVNVVIILLIMANMRVVIQNLLKYGVLVRPSSILHLARVPNVLLTCSIWLYIFAAYAIERLHGVVSARDDTLSGL